jgi:hypothetical protein
VSDPDHRARHTWIDTDEAFAEVVAELATVERYGLDT